MLKNTILQIRHLFIFWIGKQCSQLTYGGIGQLAARFTLYRDYIIIQSLHLFKIMVICELNQMKDLAIFCVF